MSSWISSSRLLLLLFSLLVMGGCSLPGVADGDSTHRFVSAFGGPGEGAGQLDLVAPYREVGGHYTEGPPTEAYYSIAGSGVAVNDENHDVYVADTGNSRVDEFNEKGEFLLAFGAEVGPLGASTCTLVPGCKKGAVGGKPGELSAELPSPRFVAVDNAPLHGDVYVGEGVGSPAQNEMQFVELNGATGGTFTLTYEGKETSAIEFTTEKGLNTREGPDAENTEKALEALTGDHDAFSVEEVANHGDKVVALQVEFRGALAETLTPELGCNGTGLAPAGTSCETNVVHTGAKPAEEVIEKFSSGGLLETGWGDGGPGGTPDGRLDVGEALGGIDGELQGVAVAPSGDLWVEDRGVVYRFEEAGKQIATPTEVGLAREPAEGIAVNAAGELYLAEQAVKKYQERGGLFQEVGPVSVAHDPGPTGFAFDEASGDVFADLGSSVADTAPGVAEPIVFGPLAGGAGIAVDPEADTVYVADSTENKVDAFGVSLQAATLAGSGVTATTATLNAEVNPQGTEVVSCVFRYGPSTSYGTRVPCEPSGPYTGSAPVKVHATVTGLTPGSTYHFGLRVVNKDGEALDTNDETLATSTAALVEESATVNVEPTSARLTATVNPKGLPVTSCAFEYGEGTGTSSYGGSVPCDPADLGSGTAPVPVGATLENLTPGTTYHWRVVLSDEHDASIPGADNTFVYIAPGEPPEVQGGCPNEGLRGESDLDPATGVALSRELPDCRAYEMVTPAQKNAALLSRVFSSPAAQINAEGTRVIATSLQCFAQSPSCTAARGINYGAPYEFSRGPTGWSTSSLAPPADVHEDYGYWYASAQTGMALFSAPVAGQVSDTLYARQPEGALEAIGPLSEALPLEEFDSGLRLAATADLSHVLFWDETKEGLWPSLISNGLPLYEYTGGANSKPFLVGVEGSEREKNIKTIGHCARFAQPSSPKYLLGAQYALSADGQVVYFDVCPAGEEDGAVGGELYARVDGEGADARTVGVSAHAPGGGAGAEECSGSCALSPASGAGLEGVSEDGSRVFFTSTQRLTNDATEDEAGGDAATSRGCAGVTGVGGCNLYLFEDPEEGGRLVDVSAGDTSGLGPQVQGVMAVSADGSHVYFVARGVLTGANLEGREPSEGADNLYMYERDEAFPAGRTVFVATLPGEKGEAPDEYETQQWEEHAKAANVTADGGFLLFTSHGALTGDDTRGLGPEQVYRYDAATGLLARVSIGEHGFNDDGNATGDVGGARIVRPESWVGQPRRNPSMSDDGSMVFFQSPVALTARALNDVPTNDGGTSVDLAQNIYEWEAPGTNGCDEAAGCIYLISDGRDATESGSSGTLTRSSVELLGTDTSGQDVFFTTADRLVGQDTDSELDYYDARVDGGFPAPKEETGCQSGEQESQPGVCRGEASEPSVFGPLASATLTGPGNVTPGEAKHLVEKPPVKTAAQIRAEKLKKALRTCKKRYAKSKKKRAACEKAAKKRYGPTHRAKRPKKSSRRRK